MILSNSHKALLVRFYRRYVLSLETITHYVVVFKTSDNRIRSMFGHFDRVSFSRIHRIGFSG